MTAKEKFKFSEPVFDALTNIARYKPLTPLPGEEKLFADLEKYCQMALDLGADEALIFPAGEIPLDLRVWWKCQFPRGYACGTNPHCPPAWKTPWAEAKLLRDSYKYAIIFRLYRTPEMWAGPGVRSKQYNAAHAKYMPSERAAAVKKELDDWIEWRNEIRQRNRQLPEEEKMRGVGGISPRIREQARKDGHYFAITFGAGSCLAAKCVDFGATCIALTSGLCRHGSKVCPEGSAALYTDFGALDAKMGWRTQVTGYCIDPKDVAERPEYFGIGLVFIE